MIVSNTNYDRLPTQLTNDLLRIERRATDYLFTPDNQSNISIVSINSIISIIVGELLMKVPVNSSIGLSTKQKIYYSTVSSQSIQTS